MELWEEGARLAFHPLLFSHRRSEGIGASCLHPFDVVRSDTNPSIAGRQHCSWLTHSSQHIKADDVDVADWLRRFGADEQITESGNHIRVFPLSAAFRETSELRMHPITVSDVEYMLTSTIQ